ncbi:MAG: ribonuclease H-like domain-containing protein [Cyanobacteria bacterium P01_F01_bin.153]
MASALGNFQAFDGDLSAIARDTYLEASELAVDTETMGLRPWRDRLCLVQLCDREGRVSVVRIERGQEEAPNLQAVLENANSTKIFHFARFDIATLWYNLNIEASPVFCTKIASKLVRTYSPKHGLKALVEELAGVDLDKSAQSSDWGNAMALSDEQLEYASNDVRYLITAKEKLEVMLDREERTELAQDCFSCLPTIVTLDLMHYDNIFEH